MLSGFGCDEDQTGWLAGLAAWATGAAAGCLLAVATEEPALLHWQVIALAGLVSFVSLGLRLPVMLAQCPGRTWLIHAVWMVAFFAQVNWAGFLAVRSASGMIACEAILICLGLEAWLLIYLLTRGQLPWLQQVFSGTAFEDIKEDASAVVPSLPSMRTKDDAERDHEVSEHENYDHEGPEQAGEIRREFIDGIDENGQRYLSGTVRVDFESEQRTDGFVLSFCPALDAVANVELECNSEEVIAKVDHATETGARITVRRLRVGEATSVTIDWFATSAATQASLSNNLP